MLAARQLLGNNGAENRAFRLEKLKGKVNEYGPAKTVAQVENVRIILLLSVTYFDINYLDQICNIFLNYGANTSAPTVRINCVCTN